MDMAKGIKGVGIDATCAKAIAAFQADKIGDVGDDAAVRTQPLSEEEVTQLVSPRVLLAESKLVWPSKEEVDANDQARLILCLADEDMQRFMKTSQTRAELDDPAHSFAHHLTALFNNASFSPIDTVKEIIGPSCDDSRRFVYELDPRYSRAFSERTIMSTYGDLKKKMNLVMSKFRLSGNNDPLRFWDFVFGDTVRRGWLTLFVEPSRPLLPLCHVALPRCLTVH